MRLQATLLILLTLLSGCAAINTQEATEYTTNQPLPREQPTTNTYNPQTLPEDGLERWRTYEQNAATFLVNDGAVAVRAFLEEGEEIHLELKTPTTLRVQQVSQSQAQFLINNESVTLRAGEEITIQEVTLHLTETITKTS